MKILFFILMATLASADEVKNRKSHVKLDLGFGPNTYRSQSLGLGLGFGPDWLLKVSGSHSLSGGLTDSGEARIGANYKSSETLDFGITAIGRTEPDNVKARGLAIDANYEISSLWDGELLTYVFADLEFVRYAQGDSSRLRIQSGETVPLNSVTLGVSQDLSLDWTLTISTTNYGYGGSNPTTLSQAISQRENAPVGLATIVSGFPKHGSSVDLYWQTSEAVGFSIGAESVESYDGFKTTTAILSSQITALKDLLIMIEGANSYTEGKSIGGLFTLGAKHLFDL